jgi:hypothetical protein
MAADAKPKAPDSIEPPKVAVVEAKPAVAAAATPAAPPAVASAVAAPDHSPVLKFDPLDFDPDRLNAAGKSSPAPPTFSSSIPDKAPVETTDNGAAGADGGPAGAVAQPAKPAGGESLARVGNASISARRGPPVENAARAAGAPLATKLRSFQVTEMPLGRFIDMVSGVAATGITLDPLAMELAGISTQSTVSVNLQDATLQSILHEALAARRLDVAEQGGPPRVVLPKSDEMHTIDYDVADLTAKSDAAAVAKLVEHFVAPESWKSAGGKGTIEVSGGSLHIEQTDAIRRELVIFCERLRLARSLAVKSKYPTALLSVESPYQRLETKLGEKTTFTFLPWTRVGDVVRGLQEMSGLTVLVDWSALAEAELGPTSPVACSARDRSWQESLDGALEPLGLAWWAVNGDTIQITTPPVLDRIQRVEFYQVPAKVRATFASNQALVEGLSKELADAAEKANKPGPAHMEVDEPSGRLVVLATPSVHRELSHRLSGSAKP